MGTYPDICATNFTEAEWKRMLDDIGALALSSSSWRFTELPKDCDHKFKKYKQSKASKKWSRSSHQWMLECVDVLEKQIPQIERCPLVEMRSQVDYVPRQQAVRTRKGALSFARRPERKTLCYTALRESTDCSENRFLRWLLERFLLPSFRAYARTLEALIVQEEVNQHIEDSVRERERLYKNSNLTPPEIPKRDPWLEKEKIESAMCTVERLLRLPFIQSARLITHISSPSERLLGTAGYREIYRSFRGLQNIGGKSLEASVRVVDAIACGRVHPTWKCYELWCFVQILRMFGELGNFKVPEGEKSFAELIEIREHEFCLVDGATIRLQRCDRCDVNVEVSYQPSLPSLRDVEGRVSLNVKCRTLKPDIKVSIQRGCRPTCHFILDPKCRDYQKQGPQKLVEDLWTTAFLKYFDGPKRYADQYPISEDKMKIRGSFILHSDPTPQNRKRNDFWGGIPAAQWLREHSTEAEECRLQKEWELGLERNGQGEPREEQEGPQGHSVGLIRLRPDSNCDFQLGRLLDMWLLFHVPYSDPDGISCPRCGEHLYFGTNIKYMETIQQNGVRDKRFRNDFRSRDHEVNYIRQWQEQKWKTSVFCECPKCAHFWFQNHCAAGRHPIIKMGRRSFHEPSKQGWSKGGMYICPTCGDDPPSSKIQKRNRS